MSKKRGLSPSASSRSSATPAPSSNFPSQSGNPELPDTASSPAQEALSVPGPSRASASSTPAPPAPKVERTVAKGGTIVPGSADDVGCGDECYLWTDLPMNKQGYRYVPCAPSPNTSPSPYFPFYRTLPGPPPSPPVHISWLDRSSFIRISQNALSATTDRGFRSARANVGVREGSWYYEVKILRGDGAPGGGGTTGGDVGNAHVRLGWGRREANFDSPIGMDGYSYGIRDVSGEKLHLSRPKPYAKAFGTGDIIGCLITLPKRPEGDMAKIKRKRVPIRYKGQLYFEMDEYGVQKEMEALVDREGKGAAAAAEAAKAALEATKEINEDKAGGKDKKGAVMKNAKKGKSGPIEPSGPVARNLPILEGSSVEFFINGESQGVAFEDLYDFLPLPPLIQPSQPGSKKSSTQHEVKDALQDDGTLGYYPMISCFGRGKVECNFGPHFNAPPPNLAARPMVERWEEFRMEEAALDERDEVADTIRLKKEMAEAEQRRIAAEAQIAARAAKGPNELKKKAAAGNVKKKRKGTETPTQEGTPVPDGVKFEVDGSVNGSSKLAMEVDTPKSAGTSRAGTEEPVVKEEGGDDVIMSSH